MASKVSYAQEEILISCEMCSKSESASSYCKDCFIHICDNCKQRHLKHTSIPVLEGLLEKLHLVNCSKDQKRYTHYCKTCKVNICEGCLSVDHRGHELENICTHGQKLRNIFSEKINSQRLVVTKIHDIMSRITKHEQDFEDMSKTQIEKVWSEIKERKEKLDAEGDNITEALKLEQNEASEKFKNQFKELQDLLIKLTNIIESLENQLSNIPDEAVLNYINKNGTKLELNLTNLTYELPKPSEFTTDFMLLGSLSRVPPERLDIELEPSPLRPELMDVGKFQPICSVVSYCDTEDGMFWVGTSESEILLIDNEGRTKLKVALQGVPWYTSITEPGDVIVSTWGHVIYKVTRQGQVVSLIDVSPDKVCGITSTQEGDVFACVESDSGWKVKKFSSEGMFVLELDPAMFIPYTDQSYVHASLDRLVWIQNGTYKAEFHLVIVTVSGHVHSRISRTDILLEDMPGDPDSILTATWDVSVYTY